MSVKPVNSAEYVPIRHVITFIAYRMNWSIMRSVEWLLARDYEQYISSYKLGEDSKYYKINDNDTTDNVDIATRYLLKRTLVIGHGAICTEGKEESKDFYKAYYKMEDLDGHYILDRLDLDFNEIYHFNFNTDAKGFVKATNHKLFDIIDGFIFSTPSVTPIKSDPYEQYLIELEQLRIDNTKNDAKIDEQLIDEYKEFIKTAKEVIDQLQVTINQQEQDIMLLNKQADKPSDDKQLTAKTINEEVSSRSQDKKLIAILAILLAQKSKVFRVGDRPNATQINEAIINLARKELHVIDDDMFGLKGNTAKISSAIQEYSYIIKNKPKDEL